MTCLRCYDFRADPEFDGHCSAYCRDRAELERLGVTALSGRPASEPDAGPAEPGDEAPEVRT